MGSSEVRQLIDEGQRYEAAGSHERALTRYRSAEEKANDPASRSEAIRRQADILRTKAEFVEALTRAEHAERIAAEHNLIDLVAEAINAQGAVHLIRGDATRAEQFFERTLEVSSHPRVRGVALQNLGIIAANLKDLEKAAAHFKDAHDACKEAGYERGALFALMNYARAVLDQGKGDVAETLLQEAEILAIHMMDLDSSHLAALNRADAMIARGAYDEAEVLVSSALGYYGSSGNPYRRLDALRLLGDITRLRGSDPQARMFYQAAHDLASKIEAGAEIEVFTRRLSELES